YGLIGFDHEIIYKIIDHPYFQRLRRIKQMGLADYVYPSANHTRFSHSLGALYLLKRSIETLKWKGVDISEEEYKAASISILLHDIGHSPFSHSLEKVFLPLGHEEVSLKLMHRLNEEFDGELDMAIQMFLGKYDRRFFHQLISGQVDVDRLDYLTRDSFFTGVAEGVIGYDRIIKMFNVVKDKLVIEEKGVYSIEKFLIARKIMYWQVYMHKTSIVADKMLNILLNYILNEAQEKDFNLLPERLKVFKEIDDVEAKIIEFTKIDDSDIIFSLKNLVNSGDELINFLANGLLTRKLLKIVLTDSKIDKKDINALVSNSKISKILDAKTKEKLFITGSENNDIYNSNIDEEILILSKNGDIEPVSKYIPFLTNMYKSVKYFGIYI
ncbi:MAG TPA: HD domain-containing protein, partial [Bacteroidetes bacterium]|nr:HD domain-containing protein [Bacteroidota bacterium]